MDRFKSKVTLDERPSGEIFCSNNWPLNVTVELSVKGEGGFELLDSFGGNPRKPKSLHVLPAFSTEILLAVVIRKSPVKTWQLEYRGAFGASLAVHDDQTRYRWPFDGTGVCESTFGQDQSKEGYYSSTFGLFAGSSVLASRRGTVMLCEADTVQVCHGDGSVATYSNLAATGVHDGQVVQEGDVIGTSTEVLKFVVTLPLGNPGLPRSIPIVFANGTPAGCVPVVGTSYENAAAKVGGPGVVGSGPLKGVKKVGPKKGVVNKQLSGVSGPVPPRSASTSSILPSAPPASASAFPNSPVVGRPLPGPAPASAPIPPRSNSTANIPPPPDRGSKVLAHDPAPQQEEPKSKYAPPALLPVKSKPPSVDRAAKPATPVMPRRDSGAGIVYVQDVHAPEGVNPSMLPGVRSAPPSRALHPELYEPARPAADPNAPVVQDSMKPGYQREFDMVDETKRVLDIRRHNPVKNTKKKLSVAAPSGSDLKHTLKGFTMF